MTEFIIPISKTTQGYLNIKGYKEFDNANRPDGLERLAYLRAVTC